TNLKCFVLIDLKAGKVTPQDIGQMNMYLNYFKLEESSEEDSEPIGIILSAKKDNILVRYALGSITNKLFISKYALYLPDKDELEHKLKVLMEEK
ncbi:MAG: PDDEXK nuclease domain-containing protein, partial [Nanoarchaeota archaeon]